MLLTSAAGATVVLAACAPAAAPSDGGGEAAPATDASASEPQMGGTLRVAFPDPPNEFDPAIMSAFPEYNSGYAMYDGLARVDANLVPQPALAESWEISEDGLTRTFTLRQGVNFHAMPEAGRVKRISVYRRSRRRTDRRGRIAR